MMKTGRNKTWLGVFLLIAIEQSIKIIINNDFLDKRFAILPPLLYFEPVFNRQYSWFNSMLHLENTKWIHVIVVFVMIALMYLFYRFLNKELGNSRIINIMFAFVWSGAVCSAIDKIFWNGSLDYVLLDHLFTFDLKDVYLNVFIGLVILSVLFKNKTLTQLEERDIFKDFAKFLLGRS
jgi:signal peptidase II